MLYSLLIGLAEAQWASALGVQSFACRESIAQVVKRALDPRTHVEDPFMLQCVSSHICRVPLCPVAIAVFLGLVTGHVAESVEHHRSLRVMS
jgi:hypothetical protein